MREVRFCIRIRIRRKKLLYVKVSWKSFYSKFYDRDCNLESRRSETLLSGVRKNELSYAGSEFGEMFECLSKKMDAPYRNWLLGMKIQMERRDGKTFSEIWEDNVNGFLKESGLGMEALNHLKMLGRNLGGADRQMQIWSMERYLKQIELQMDEMRKDIQMRMKVRICLGASAGILITIFLI